MPEPQKDLYAASCNPPRRAKRAPIPAVDSASSTSSSPSSGSGSTFQMRPYTPRTTVPETEPTEAPPAPAKRGRKPGPLSRSAREAQRRLNHSIIEKARRTKINDALASLRQLVPVDYGQPKTAPQESRDEDGDDTDGEYEEGANKDKAAAKGKGKGKKEEKEKEFKLEILVRTVSFLQDLLKRVAALEGAALELPVQAPCQNCSAGKESRKRKHIHVEEDDGTNTPGPHRQDIFNADDHPRSAKTPRHAENTSPPGDTLIRKTPDVSPVVMPSGSSPRQGASSQAHSQQKDADRLPSISSWLPNSAIDPQLLTTHSKSARSSPHMGSYLPSPPSSTHFDPVRTSQVPPLLNLGPVATAAIVGPNPSRTPEDESAASLLLQISASSPPFRPVRSSSNASHYGLPDPSSFLLHSDTSRTAQREGGQVVRQAQTPGSMLGLNANIITSTKY